MYFVTYTYGYNIEPPEYRSNFEHLEVGDTILNMLRGIIMQIIALLKMFPVYVVRKKSVCKYLFLSLEKSPFCWGIGQNLCFLKVSLKEFQSDHDLTQPRFNATPILCHPDLTRPRFNATWIYRNLYLSRPQFIATSIYRDYFLEYLKNQDYSPEAHL